MGTLDPPGLAPSNWQLDTSRARLDHSTRINSRYQFWPCKLVLVSAADKVTLRGIAGGGASPHGQAIGELCGCVEGVY